MLKTIEPLVTNESDTAHSFALEMKKQIQSYFSFLLYPTKPDFLPIYWVATFLCPVYRFVITSEEMPVVRSYLESKFNRKNNAFSSKINILRCCFSVGFAPKSANCRLKQQPSVCSPRRSQLSQ